MELTSGKEALRKWEEVLGRRQLLRRRLVAASADASDDDGGDGMHGRRRQRRQQSMVSLRGDPFDCSDVTVPPISELVEREVDIWASVWRDLDSRRVRSNTQGRGDQGGQSTTRRKRKMARTRSENVQAEDVDVNHDEDKGDNRSLIDKSADRYDIKNDDDGVRKMPGRKISRWRLPDGFDVTCRSDRQIFPDVVSSSSQRGKVISLADPTKFLDYDAELYKIFSSVPAGATYKKCALTYTDMDVGKTFPQPPYLCQETCDKDASCVAYVINGAGTLCWTMTNSGGSAFASYYRITS